VPIASSRQSAVQLDSHALEEVLGRVVVVVHDVARAAELEIARLPRGQIVEAGASFGDDGIERGELLGEVVGELQQARAVVLAHESRIPRVRMRCLRLGEALSSGTRSTGSPTMAETLARASK
jgi:hypothetical protein